MKKIAILSTLFLMFGAYIYFDCIDSTETLSELQLANIEALAGGESGASNTGPREEKKCYGGGHKMVCRSINSESCTDSNCY